VQSKALQQNTIDHIDAWQAVVTADMSLGEWVTRVQDALKALEGGEDPLSPSSGKLALVRLAGTREGAKLASIEGVPTVGCG
jgi:hypothetical protein